MRSESPSRETTFGFLSTLETAEHGYFGGYLIVSGFGRPLEFHCTSPVRPSRAQEILYGPTLQPYLLGEQIGVVLLQAAKLTPRLILTDQLAILNSRQHAKSPMALVLSPTKTGATGLSEPYCDPVSTSNDSDFDPLATVTGNLTGGNYDLQMPPGFAAEKNVVLELVSQLGEHVDLAEPFCRIHEAIREAQRIGGRTPQAHGQAA